MQLENLRRRSKPVAERDQRFSKETRESDNKNKLLERS